MAIPPDTARARVLALLDGERGTGAVCFSPLSTIIAPALETRGLKFHEIHHDADKMVTAAAAAFELYGWQAATLPTDLIVEAEALGAPIDFRDDMPEPMWPLVPIPRYRSSVEITVPPGDFARRGRIPLVCAALRSLRQRVGDKIVVGAWIAGPFTLAMQVADYNVLLPEVKHSPWQVGHALDVLTDALVSEANAYYAAGADFITIHEMGGSPGVLGPRAFGDLILPRLRRLILSVRAPTILSVCGKTNKAMELLAEAGATAIHVDHTNDLASSRTLLGNKALLFGNLDPVGVIAQGDAASIRAAVQQVAGAGADAVMPGCDLYLDTPEGNMRALVEAVKG